MRSSPGRWRGQLLARPWLLAFVPINAATSGFGVMLPLLILLRLHGSLLDVALAAVLFNISIILASILWGHLADRYPNRRLFLLVNFAGFGVAYALLGAAPSLPLLLVVYTLIGLVSPAGGNASNLLLLEQFSEAERPAAYASFQEMSILGAIGGVLVGYAWLELGEALTPLLFVFSLLAFLSVSAVLLGVPPSPRRASALEAVRSRDSLISRLRHSVAFRGSIPFFPRVRLRPGLLARFRLWVVEEMHHELPLILIAGFLFNFAANLFNTSYTPYLRSIGIASASIFLVNFANNLTQGFLYPLSGSLARREGSDRLVRQATYVRSLGYLATVGFTFVPLTVLLAFSANAVTFAVLGGAIALYSTASSLILFRSLARRDAGTVLGVNGALGGVAAVVGALASGLISFYVSYRATFLVAAGALLVSLPLWAAAEVSYGHRLGIGGERRGRRRALPRQSGSAAEDGPGEAAPGPRADGPGPPTG
jgi:MFS family permease